MPTKTVTIFWPPDVDECLVLEYQITCPSVLKDGDKSITMKLLNYNTDNFDFSSSSSRNLELFVTSDTPSGYGNIFKYVFEIYSIKSNGEFTFPLNQSVTKAPSNYYNWPILSDDGRDQNCQITDGSYHFLEPKIATVNASPIIDIPVNSVNSLITPGARIPEGWPLICGNKVENLKANVKFLDSFVHWNYSASDLELSKVECGFRYKDVSGNYGIKYFEMNLGYDESDGQIAYRTSLEIPSLDKFYNNVPEFQLAFRVTDNRNRKFANYFGNWVLPIYEAPKITSFIVERCSSEGVIDDEGTYAIASGTWTLWDPPNVDEEYKNHVVFSSILVDETYHSTEVYTPLDVIENVESGSQYILGNGSLSQEGEYISSLTVRDLIKTTSQETEIDQSYCTMDFLAGGKGIAFGTASTKPGFVCDMEAYFENPVHVIDEPFTVEKHLLKDFSTEGSLYDDYPVFELNPETGCLQVSKLVEQVGSGGPYNSKNTRIYPNAIGMSDNDLNWRSSESIVGDVDSIGRRFEINLYDSSASSFVNFLRLKQTETEFGNPVNIASGGTGAKNRVEAFKNLAWLGINPTGGIANDTREKWKQLGSGFAYISENSQLNGQPNQWGFVISLVYASEIHQEFWVQSNGAHYQRGVNGQSDNNMPKWEPSGWKAIYPVGAVYISYVSTSPASLFGGSWTQITGVVLRADNNVSTNSSTGSDTHTHGAGTYTSRLDVMSDLYMYWQYRTTPSGNWTPNYWAGKFASRGNTGISHTPGSGIIVDGTSSSATTLPKYQNLYVWRRTA